MVSIDRRLDVSTKSEAQLQYSAGSWPWKFLAIESLKGQVSSAYHSPILPTIIRILGIMSMLFDPDEVISAKLHYVLRAKYAIPFIFSCFEGKETQSLAIKVIKCSWIKIFKTEEANCSTLELVPRPRKALKEMISDASA